MKETIRKIAKTAQKSAVLLMLGVAASVCSLQPSTFGQASNPNLTTFTNLPAWPTLTLTNATGVSYVTPTQATNAAAVGYVPLYVNSGLAVQLLFAQPLSGVWTNGTAETNATGTLNAWFWPSVDGTNALPYTIGTLAGTPSTNLVIVGTNWSQQTLNGFRGLFVTISNNSTLPMIVGGTITNTTSSATNIYSAGFLFSRPVR